MDFNLSADLLSNFQTGAILAAGGHIAPEPLPGLGWFTNSLFVAVFVMLLVLWFTRMATKKMATVPGKKQNLVEFVVEFVYGQVEGIVGKHVAPRVFPLLATIFIFVLVSNWFGLIPGVGTIGFGGDKADMAAPLLIKKDAAEFTGLLRPATADLNFTLALALVFMVVWAWVTVREIGVWGFLVHTFGPKGGLQGVIKYLLIPIFLFVGVIEIISIAFRPVSLSFRLFGNVFAGESLLAAMSGIGKTLGIEAGWLQFILSVVAPLPFYFLEILVGLLQAIVFTLLCAVYVQLSTTHEEEH
ncbi:MAG: F0F1 ATP synthase subunit A [Verrucomicrobiales bacterium]|nr:F0F1 ATP synthase subunit A [Verrucomicrobiales bacterium]